MPLRAAAVALMLSIAIAFPVAADTPSLATAIDEAIANAPGSVAVVVVDVASGYRYERQSATAFEAASLFKLYVMAAAYERARSDPDFLTSTVAVVRPQVTNGTVVNVNTAETVLAAMAQMIQWSDNAATAALVDAIGLDAIATTLADLGLRDTVVRSAEPTGNVTTARDVAWFFEKLAARDLVSRQGSDAMTWLLMHQDINDRLPQGLPVGTLIAHKTGNSAGTYHDAGIIWTPYGTRVVVVMTDRLDGDAARALIEQIAYWSYSLPAPVVD